MIKKHDLDTIAKSKGFILEELSGGQDMTPSTKITITCVGGHKTYRPRASKLHLIKKCKQCYPNLEKIQKTFFSIQDEVKTMGYTLSEEETSINIRKLHIICDKHGTFTKSIHDLRKGSGCPECAKLSFSNKTKKPFEDLVAMLAKNNNKPNFTKEWYYSNLTGKTLSIICSCGNVVNRAVENFEKYRGCRNCNGSGLKNEEEVNQILKVHNLSLIGKYEGANNPVDMLCEKHGIITMRVADVSNGHGCKKCSNIISYNELELSNIIREWGLDVKNNDRSVLSGKEIDIFIPTINVGIEYTGLRFHSEIIHKDKYNIRNKHDIANQKGIELITIYENEWIESKEKVLSYLQAKLGVGKSIYARNTEAVALSRREANSFNNKWHLQGASKIKIAVGLKHKGVLVGVMTFANHHRDPSKGVVLNRLCFGDKRVVGGASKMLKFAIPLIREMGFDQIITWSDNRWSNGTVYRSMGFSLDRHLPPDYVYFKRQRVFSKQSCKKHNLIKKGAIGDTEREMANSLGLYRIWDAGKIRWLLKI